MLLIKDISKISKNSVQLCKKLSFWTTFFDNNNLRIHLDTIEIGLVIIIKQIELQETSTDVLNFNLGRYDSITVISLNKNL